MRFRPTVVAFVISSFLLSSSAIAQQAHIVPPASLRHAVANQALADQQNRDVLLTVLHRSDVTELASRLGLSLTRAEDAIATLDSVELARLAGQARTTDAALAGGSDTIIISTTALLLIIIIVILVAR